MSMYSHGPSVQTLGHQGHRPKPPKKKDYRWGNDGGDGVTDVDTTRWESIHMFPPVILWN